MTHRALRFVAPLTLVATVPWVALVWGCSCPTNNREMKLTPDGLKVLGSAAASDNLTQEQCQALCEGKAPDQTAAGSHSFLIWSCKLSHDGSDTLVDCAGTMPCVGGRRPDGELAGTTTEEGYFGALAALEGASVVAFLDLAEDLALHGAPTALVARAQRAAREEVRHARATARLAFARGERPQRVEIASRCPHGKRHVAPTLVELATSNAVEGCVRESFGALIASHQAQQAADADVRGVMTFIADDELSHAKLARDIDAWMQTRLSRRTRALVAEVHEAARGEIIAAAAYEVGSARRAAMGWPSAERAVELAHQV